MQDRRETTVGCNAIDEAPFHIIVSLGIALLQDDAQIAGIELELILVGQYEPIIRKRRAGALIDRWIDVLQPWTTGDRMDAAPEFAGDLANPIERRIGGTAHVRVHQKRFHAVRTIVLQHVRQDFDKCPRDGSKMNLQTIFQ